MDFADLAQHCAPTVQPVTMAAIARVESGFNPFAIGVVSGRLVRQPANREEAIATAVALERGGYNFSVGISQVNRYNLPKYGLDYASAFDSCANLRAGASILGECYGRATAARPDPQQALRAALSCYYSGNFVTGFREGYVARVVANAQPGNNPNPAVAPIAVISTLQPASRSRSSSKPARVAPLTTPVPATTAVSSEPQSALLF